MSDKIKNQRRVVVTGLGVISSLGIGWEEFWKNLIAGKSGISKITSFDTSQYDRHYGGEVKNFKPEDFIAKSKLKYLGRASQMAIAASKLAIKDAKLTLKDMQKMKAGISLGTTMGEARIIEEIVYGYSKLKKVQAKNLLALTYPANSISVNVALELKLKGKNFVFANACAAGNYAVGYAYDLVRRGKTDIMLAGGSDSISRIAYTGFNRLIAVAPEKCQPFDENRKGMIPGEGSGIVVVENLESALQRKAPIYAEIKGYGLSSDAYHMTEPRIDGVCKSVKKSLINAGVSPEQIDYISAHGTGTKENDLAECQAVKRVFGKKGSEIPMSSIKSMLGHTMGAASCFETISCCLVLQKNEIPPTINLINQDSECNINCVPNRSVKRKSRVVLNNSQAFGGNNACIVLRK